MSHCEPYFKPFDETDPYTQEDAPGLSFRKVLPVGLIPDVDMGLVTLEGPAHKFPGSHDSFDQAYLVYRGTGHINLGDDRIRIDRPGIVVIPHGTRHSMEADAGQTMQYVYVNHAVHA